jgi:hypothetical protein
MIKHDEARFDAFETLAQCMDDNDFVARLRDAFAGLGIGQSLDFSPVAQFWLQGGELPLAWRLELARQTPFDLDAFSRYDAYQAPCLLQKKLFQGEASAAWIGRAERLLMLTTPLASPAILHYLLDYDGLWVSAERDTAYDGTLGVGLRAWAEQIAQGVGEWGSISHWLHDAGTEPALLAHELAAKLGPISINSVIAFAGLRLFLLQVREQLLLGQLSADGWIDLLLVHLHRLDQHWSMQRHPLPLGLAHHCALPLLKLLYASPRLAAMLNEPEPEEGGYLYRLFDDLALGVFFAQSPTHFQRLLERAADQAIDNMRLSSDFAAQFPECALLFEQQSHARGFRFRAQTQSAAARDWYLSIIGSAEGSFVEALLNQLQLSCTAEQLHQVILDHVVPRQDQELSISFVERLDNAEHLLSYLACENNTLRYLLTSRLFALATGALPESPEESEGDEQAPRYVRHPHNWTVLLKACAQYPTLFLHTLGGWKLELDELSRWQLIWDNAKPDKRAGVAERFLLAIDRTQHGEHVLALAEQLYAQEPQPWLDAVAEQQAYLLNSQIVTLSQRDSPLSQLLPAMAARYLTENAAWFRSAAKETLSAIAAVRQALVRYPQAYAELEEKAQIKLLQLFDDSTLIACAAPLVQLLSSNSKLLRDPAVTLIARSSVAAIEAAHLLQAVPKARKLVLIGMALSNEAAMLDLLIQHFSDNAHDDYSRGLSLNALERGGHSLTGLDPWAGIELATLQAQAQGLKIPAAVSKYWNAEFAALLAPLGEALGLQLLHLLYEGTEELPRRARQVLGFLPAGQRSDFALLGAQQWIAANGAVELDWLLSPLPVYGDERIANDLVKAIKDWKKARKQKASAAMRLLCQLPGNFGVAQVRELWESGKFSESIESAAELALTEAGQRQGMSLAEFLEQLVPDFGMTHQGLMLDVGPYQYVVRMRPDLSLVVLDEKGKASKSLPKAKAGEDLDKRSLAENQYKALAKNLKPVFKQQSKRLTRLFQLGSRWPTATWQRVFVAHPLMAVIAQSVVWSADDAQGQPLKRFRPAEGGELIDLNDEPYQLPADAVVHATHPLELDEAERAAWVTHFADYALQSPIEQWSTPVLVPDAELLSADRLPLPADKLINRGKFASLVDKWGYSKGQAGDGAQVCEHTWLLDGGQLLVTLNHGDIFVYFDPDATVSLHDLQVHRRDAEGFARQRLGDLPPAFLNTLLVQAAALSAQAV